ncbi:MAG: hypothetical protein IPF50_07045 [Proteobacteria bacterium]|nr:hypothetical protein [Pseudomonadota bacterium]
MSVATFAVAGFGTVASADAAAGKAKFAAACAECHEVADFEGESAAALTESLKKIVAGTQKHKDALKPTDAEIADLAALRLPASNARGYERGPGRARPGLTFLIR